MPPEIPTPMEENSAVPSMPPQETTASDEQRQQLFSILEQIRAKLGELHSMKFAGSNRSNQARADALRQVFSALQAAGIDISDQEAVAQFIEQLRAQSPELAQFFEEAVGSLLGDQGNMNMQDPMMNQEGNNEVTSPQGPGTEVAR